MTGLVLVALINSSNLATISLLLLSDCESPLIPDINSVIAPVAATIGAANAVVITKSFNSSNLVVSSEFNAADKATIPDAIAVNDVPTVAKPGANAANSVNVPSGLPNKEAAERLINPAPSAINPTPVTASALALSIVSDDIASPNAENPGAAAVNVTEESTGISAAYSMGSASIRLSHNEADNVGGVTGVKDDNTEISLALSF